ncbi:SDR family oxidoreductase [Lentzea sp. HUAS12]|uniref:SDR family NAD(P)-dependent oxidoreductase n=1 Tax=Lentzea sp. HUAS12 TaxID=2951806 RepID=UPI00209DAC3D|nr:SDR family NAD(P)-dependent oxidoreductase [Lentzea sp. HUAS12]USX56703.1 SDR family NAD(P)-dependent oxidoreductase [Lentzea sp. HUAS12]
MITGAGAGIGRALAIELARRGARLSLLDRDAAALEGSVARCEAYGARVLSHAVDVTNWDEVQAAAGVVNSAFGGVDSVFAAAGTIHRGSLLDSDVADIEQVMAVNWRGSVYTVKAHLPFVLGSAEGRIVTFSSAFGLVATSKYTAYNASKFAVRGFSEALRQELAAAGSSTSVTCVFPGGVRTSIVRNGLFAAGENREAVIRGFEKRVARTEPDRAAVTILSGAERRRARVFVGADARLVASLARLLGGHYQDVLPALEGFLRRKRPRRGPGRAGSG